VRVLAGDIGGTHARIAIVDVDDRGVRLARLKIYDSRSHSGLEPIVLDFISGGSEKVERATFGIACPVMNGECATPNLPWKVSARALAAATGIEHTDVINDLHAMALGITRVEAGDVVTLQRGNPAAHGVIALIGAGTGLGQAFAAWDGRRYRAFASEGGHSTFAPRSKLEWELHDFLARELGHVSYERVVSGPGLVGVYRFLAARPGAAEDPEVRAAVASEGAVAVSRYGLASTDPISAAALDLFISSYGDQAGNLALHLLATGGVYLVGRIARAMAEKLRDGIFMTAFRDKGRMGELLCRVPVNVVVNTQIGLVGAAVAASENPVQLDDTGAAAPSFNETLGAR
jgi:glucokinase